MVKAEVVLVALCEGLEVHEAGPVGGGDDVCSCGEEGVEAGEAGEAGDGFFVDGEHAAEAAALVGALYGDGCEVHVCQQGADAIWRLGAEWGCKFGGWPEAEFAEAMTAGMYGDPVLAAPGQVLDLLDIVQEFTQFVGAVAGSGMVPQLPVEVAYRGDAAGRWTDDGVEVCKGLFEAVCEGCNFAGARVDEGLAAADLGSGEGYVELVGFEQAQGGDGSWRIELVDKARDEEGNACGHWVSALGTNRMPIMVGTGRQGLPGRGLLGLSMMMLWPLGGSLHRLPAG